MRAHVGEGFLERWHHLFLPAVSTAIRLIPVLTASLRIWRLGAGTEEAQRTLDQHADRQRVGRVHDDRARDIRQQVHERERLAKLGLALHPDKTRLIEFGRYAAKEGGWFTLVRHTIAKRMRARLVEIKEALNRMRHVPVTEQGHWPGQVVRGYLAYHAVPTNSRKITSFHHLVVGHWRRALSRRSQKGNVSWTRMEKIGARWLPPARISHPWPQRRFLGLVGSGQRHDRPSRRSHAQRRARCHWPRR